MAAIGVLAVLTGCAGTGNDRLRAETEVTVAKLSKLGRIQRAQLEGALLFAAAQLQVDIKPVDNEEG